MSETADWFGMPLQKASQQEKQVKKSKGASDLFGNPIVIESCPVMLPQVKVEESQKPDTRKAKNGKLRVIDLTTKEKESISVEP